MLKVFLRKIAHVFAKRRTLKWLKSHPSVGGPLADPKLQKVTVEQADPLGVSVGCRRLPPSIISACKYFQWKCHFFHFGGSTHFAWKSSPGNMSVSVGVSVSSSSSRNPL